MILPEALASAGTTRLSPNVSPVVIFQRGAASRRAAWCGLTAFGFIE